MSKQKQLQLNSFKNWKTGSYKITQYKRFLYIVSLDGSDIWQAKTLRGAVKYTTKHNKSK